MEGISHQASTEAATFQYCTCLAYLGEEKLSFPTASLGLVTSLSERQGFTCLHFLIIVLAGDSRTALSAQMGAVASLLGGASAAFPGLLAMATTSAPHPKGWPATP